MKINFSTQIKITIANVHPGKMSKKVKQDLQHPNWVFTFNYGKEDQPPLEAALRFVNDTIPPICDYFVAGFETAPTTGQTHVQGYIQLNKRKRLTELKKLPDAGTIHWEVAKGDEVQNREYCLKSCNDDFVEGGEAKCVNGRVQEKKRWDDAKAFAKSGELDAVCPQIYVSHYSSLRCIARDNLGCCKDEPDVTGIWIYGGSGSGKSHWARQRYGGGTDMLYLKPINKWWDGFRKDQHVNVLLEDMEPSQSVLGYHLKIWADRYSFPAEIKGSTIQIRPKRIIVTSQYHPGQIWTDTETQTAILRRFRVLKKTTKEKDPEPENLSEQELRDLIFVQPETTKTETTPLITSSSAKNVSGELELHTSESHSKTPRAVRATTSTDRVITLCDSPTSSHTQKETTNDGSGKTDPESNVPETIASTSVASLDLIETVRRFPQYREIIDLIRALEPPN
ncbi:Rep [uncultured virus]|uniref:ATP-dependent helicase Rep n=1 Tax=uncultured virus TaxID=340016 RepID=A0A2K9LW15_9VIRU|nr:Rep [uncultured virus]